MLKNIRLHIEKDEQKQEELEAKLAESLQTVHKDNINAFQRHIPSLIPYVTQIKSQNLSIFCNKFGQFNIVDYGLGRVLYGFDPKQDAQDQVDEFLRHGLYVSLTQVAEQNSENQSNSQVDPELLEALPTLEKHLEYPPVPNKVDCLVVMGIGLGYHIQALIEACSPRFVIIYEPEVQYFSSSVMVFDWKSVLTYAKQNDISLFFMLEKDGRDILSNIEELREQFPIDGFYLYKHYNHPIFNSIQKQLLNTQWDSIKNKGFHFQFTEDPNQYTQIFSDSTHLEQYHLAHREADLFQKNIKAFETYFPAIAKEFREYTPKVWLPVETPDGQINLVNKDNLICWYSDKPQQDCLTNFRGFSDHPNKDGLVLGYKGKKLAHYLHYKFVKETDDLLEAVEDEEGALPENIQSMIMFGLGVGYQLEYLIKEHTLEKVFLCEPNPDFFYGSLFAIDWETIFQSIDEEKGKLYINIGDDGTNLFRDLLSQFYSIGPYILNNTFFYQSYYNADLNMAISKLREQLQVVITMGEYFDHAYHGIAQTKAALQREIPSLIRDPQKVLSFYEREVPVFLVGNGPSLDKSFEVIREWQDQAIIVSCGTTLQVMHRNGIVPDFHAEIEQNRTSYDWASIIGDFEYLKQVSLISCNGIHPDTCDLYKDVYIAFKEGESSTVSTLSVIGEKDFSVLQFAFPTVANFACNLFSTLGFKNIYLIGIDMGFINNKNHHSKQSAYYKDDGAEMYDYSKSINTSFVVPGNFRKTVYTKHEFKIAKMVLEQAIATSPKDVSFFNCSDGAQIIGAAPLTIDSVLVTASSEDKQEAVSKLKNNAFKHLDSQDVITRYDNRYSKDILAKELDAFGNWLKKPVSSVKEAEAMIDQQKNLLFLSYQNGRSLLFYYLYGTVNFANAMLTKLLYSSKENGVEQFGKGLAIWKDYFEQFKEMMLGQQDAFDISTSPNDLLKRAYKVMQHKYKNKRVAVINNSSGYVQAMAHFIEHSLQLLDIELVFLNKEEFLNNDFSKSKESFDYVIYHFVDEFDAPDLSTPDSALQFMQLKGESGTLLVDYHFNRSELEQLHQQWEGNLTVLKIARDPRPFRQFSWYSDLARTALGSIWGALESHYHVIFAKYPVVENYDVEEFKAAACFPVEEGDRVYNHYRHLCIDFNGEKGSTGLMAVGDRGTHITTLSDHNLFVSFELTAEHFQVACERMEEVYPLVVKDIPFASV